MAPFRYARDLYVDQAAQQLLPAAAWLFVAVVGVFIAVHLLRRSVGYPVANTGAATLSPHARVVRYELGARLYHWGNTFLMLGLALSGVALYSPGSLSGSAWLVIHEVLAVLFIIALVLHIVVAPTRGEGRSMWFDSKDVRDLRLIAANFVGLTHTYPALGKYDPWQKVYHALLALIAAALIFSGAYLFISAEAWGTFSHAWMRLMRLLHGVGAFALIAIIVGHVYFGIIRVNWPQLVSMFTGRLRGSSFNLYHDAARWRPRDD
ncbi:MAG TPA: cytochrome b/b6 domain-containing protein [Vicinamibacterales bacterium]|nr:cytochrome b/b6 domain-containing protein [Vicinamibacterales bacterium]